MFFWVTWIVGGALHRFVVVIVFEEELLAVDLEATEVVLLVRIVVRREFVERPRQLDYAGPILSGRALRPAVMTTRPPVTDLRKPYPIGFGASGRWVASAIIASDGERRWP